MATPLNVFKSTVKNLVAVPNDSDSNALIYQVPNGITAIVLMAQISNIGTTTNKVTFMLSDSDNSNMVKLVKEYSVIPHDAVGVLTGKLIAEENDKIWCYADSDDKLQLTLSYLESLNG